MQGYTQQTLFEEVRDFFKEGLDLELTLIEQVCLKQYIPSILESTKKCECTSLSEVVTRFLADYYGIDTTLNFVQKFFYKDREVFKQYLKIIQEQCHKP